MKVDYLLDSNCEACRADAPKVTKDELIELKIEKTGLLFCIF